MDKKTTANRLVVFESSLEKIRLGIRKGLWMCKFYNQHTFDEHYWKLEALSGDYTIKVEYSDQGSYSFTINKKEEVILDEVKESSSEAEFNFIKDYFLKLLLEYEKFLEEVLPN